MLANDQNTLVPVESIAQSILLIRGQKVIIAPIWPRSMECRRSASMSR